MRKNCQKYFFVPFIYFGIANNINKHKVLAKSRLHICTNFTLFFHVGIYFPMRANMNKPCQTRVQEQEFQD